METIRLSGYSLERPHRKSLSGKPFVKINSLCGREVEGSRKPSDSTREPT
jgi:hypothetical protein